MLEASCVELRMWMRAILAFRLLWLSYWCIWTDSHQFRNDFISLRDTVCRSHSVVCEEASAGCCTLCHLIKISKPHVIICHPVYRMRSFAITHMYVCVCECALCFKFSRKQQHFQQNSNTLHDDDIWVNWAYRKMKEKNNDFFCWGCHTNRF